MTALAIALTIAGGTLELSGLWLVWRDITRDRERAGELLRAKTRAPRPQRSYPAPLSAPVASSFAGLRSQETALRELEASVGKLAAMVGNLLIETRKVLDASLDRSTQALERELDEQDGELRRILRDILAGSIRDREIGAALLACGIVLAATGSVVGTLA